MTSHTGYYAAAIILGLFVPIHAEAQTPALPESIRAEGATALLTLFAEGAQVYECKTDATGKLAWSFREPVATLINNGQTVGRHYTGPSWELADSSIVQGKVSGRAPGTTSADIPWLKLDVSASKGQGALSGITIIQRINTKGGVLEGTCDKAGNTRSVAYSTDYVFLKK